MWSPDGTRIAFDSHRSGTGDLYVKDLTGAGEEKRLLAWTEIAGAASWSSDSQFLAFTSDGPKTGADTWILPFQPGQRPFPFLKTEANEYDATFAPNGKWIAYTSDESGRPEIYVQSFNGTDVQGGGKWQISTGGGSQPDWRRDGREIFFLSPDNALMAAEVNASTTFEIRSRRKLFDTGLRVIRWRAYTVNPDGTRFLLRMPAHGKPPVPVNVVVNRPAILKH